MPVSLASLEKAPLLSMPEAKWEKNVAQCNGPEKKLARRKASSASITQFCQSIVCWSTSDSDAVFDELPKESPH